MGYKGKIPATHYGTADVHLDTGPGVIYWVLVQAGASAGTVQVRDGPDDGVDVILCIETLANRSNLTVFDPPCPYRQGLYIDPDTNVDTFTIAYDHLES